ncbi:hypothetical protein B9Z19DRAFT_1121693 [Tuber borchii]|uniref:COG4 transport protein middle alpha-helical bundle domain-containing protein n=1 Tax=Tuber borchii TaxID=42251 RepID=A0A2T7A245_TUBBO|nr:hypothetical protein B9Z19DRAFT_1121693 [Tuber borchii]
MKKTTSHHLPRMSILALPLKNFKRSSPFNYPRPSHRQQTRHVIKHHALPCGNNYAATVRRLDIEKFGGHWVDRCIAGLGNCSEFLIPRWEDAEGDYPWRVRRENMEQHGKLVERHGEGRIGKVIDRLQVEADTPGGIIIDTFRDDRSIDGKLTDIKSYGFSFLVQSYVPPIRRPMGGPGRYHPGRQQSGNGRQQRLPNTVGRTLGLLNRSNNFVKPLPRPLLAETFRDMEYFISLEGDGNTYSHSGTDNEDETEGVGPESRDELAKLSFQADLGYAVRISELGAIRLESSFICLAVNMEEDKVGYLLTEAGGGGEDGGGAESGLEVEEKES